MIPSTARLASAAADVGGTPLVLCLHCGSPVPSSRSDGYCCAGCMAVRRLLGDAGLDGYYALRPPRIRPLLDYFERQSSLEWLDEDPGAASGRLDLAVEGIQCAACVWAIEKLARRDGLARLGVNSALGQLSLRFDPARFDARAYLEALADFGYRVRPAADAGAGADPSRGLLLRLGVCAAITMNTMSFSLPFYLGLADGAGPLQSWLRGLSVLLTTVAVGYGGSYFFGRAWRSARHGIAHFDIPVAIGILAAYAGSLWALAEGRTDALYLDSVNVFLTFMLLGRFLQERTLQRNRRQLLRSDAFGLAQVTALDPRVHDIPWREVRPGTRLLLQPGSLCPAEATLRSPRALEFDLASLTGERAPATVQPGGPVRAGARLISNRPARVDARAGFDASALAALVPRERGEEELPVLWRWSVKVYVFVVLAAALAGLVGWWPTDPQRAAQVFISVLVVTCPCGLGIAVPLARTLADQRLARGGVTVRRPGVLDRLLTVRQVWLDKTGTLTLADLELKDDGAIDALDDAARRALMGAAGASRHPVSRALFHELTARGTPYPDDGDATEIPGQGVRFVDGAGDWFLGRTMAPDGAARAELRRDGRPVAAFCLTERVLMDGAASVQRLRGLGLGVGLLSGDAPTRVAAMADQLGLREGEARGDLGPADKARAVALVPSLMLGDGLNDSLALQRAVVSGSPAWERSALADESDLSFASGSLAWLPELFRTARTLHRVMWGNLIFAWGYNGLLIALALSGRFSPLLCAVTMPASSLVVSAATMRALGRGGR